MWKPAAEKSVVPLQIPKAVVLRLLRHRHTWRLRLTLPVDLTG